MELLLCRAHPRDLLTGKVLGIGLVGLAQMLLAPFAAGAAILVFDTLDVPAAVPATLASAVVAFVLGYAFWSVAFAAVGALALRVEDLRPRIHHSLGRRRCRPWRALVAADFPDEWYTRAASFFPTTAPFVMPVRIADGDVAGLGDRTCGDDRDRRDLRARPARRRRLLGCAVAHGRPAPSSSTSARRARRLSGGRGVVPAERTGRRPCAVRVSRTERHAADVRDHARTVRRRVVDASRRGTEGARRSARAARRSSRP